MSSARSVLLIIAVAYASLGVIAFLLSRRQVFVDAETEQITRAGSIEKELCAAVFLVCWLAARRAPFVAIAVVTGLWVIVQSLSLVLSLALFSQLWLQLVVAILLVRGIVASVRAHAYVKSCGSRPERPLGLGATAYKPPRAERKSHARPARGFVR